MIVTEAMEIVIEAMTVTEVMVTGIEAMEAVHGIVCRRLQRRDLSLPWHLGVRQRRMMTAVQHLLPFLEELNLWIQPRGRRK